MSLKVILPISYQLHFKSLLKVSKTKRMKTAKINGVKIYKQKLITAKCSVDEF